MSFMTIPKMLMRLSLHTYLYLITGFLLFLILFTPFAWAKPQIGQPAPDFSLVDTQGQPRRLSDFADQTVVLEWTNHDCPLVRKHYNSDNMQTLQKTFTQQDVVWLSVISSAPGEQGHVSPEEANALTTKRGAFPTAILIDESGVMGRAYDARVTPHMYVIHKGVLVYMGGIDSIPSANPADVPKAEPFTANAIKAVLAGEPIATPSTRPYGCTIKYR